MKTSSGEDTRSQLLQALIGCEQHGRLAAGKGQCLCLQVAVGLRRQHQIGFADGSALSMVRTTAEASSTRLAISAGPALADQHLRCRIEALPAPLISQPLEIGKGLPASLTGIAPARLLRLG